MGNYITEALLEARVGENMLAKMVQQPSGSTAYSAAVTDVIERAEGQVDAYLSERFTVPVTSTGLMEEVSLSIAEWELYRRGQGNVPMKVKDSYDYAITTLKAIRDGEMGTGASTTPSSSGGVGLETDGATGLFDATSMEDAAW